MLFAWVPTTAGALLATYATVVVVLGLVRHRSSPRTEIAPAELLSGIGIMAAFAPLAVNEQSGVARLLGLAGAVSMGAGAVWTLFTIGPTGRGH